MMFFLHPDMMRHAAARLSAMLGAFGNVFMARFWRREIRCFDCGTLGETERATRKA